MIPTGYNYLCIIAGTGRGASTVKIPSWKGNMLKGMVAWSAFNKFDCKHKLQKYQLTYEVL